MEFTQREIERFWSYVREERGDHACWVWTGRHSRDQPPLSLFRIRRDGKNIDLSAQRIAYVLLHGPIDRTTGIHHRPECSNSLCVRHLYAGKRYGRADAIFPDATVNAMRRDYESGTWTILALSQKYGISIGHTCDLVHYKKRPFTLKE